MRAEGKSHHTDRSSVETGYQPVLSGVKLNLNLDSKEMKYFAARQGMGIALLSFAFLLGGCQFLPDPSSKVTAFDELKTNMTTEQVIDVMGGQPIRREGYGVLGVTGEKLVFSDLRYEYVVIVGAVPGIGSAVISKSMTPRGAFESK